MLITDHLKDRNVSERSLGRPAEPRVLIADDQADVLEALRLLLKAEGFHLETASSPAGVLAALEAREPGFGNREQARGIAIGSRVHLAIRLGS